MSQQTHVAMFGATLQTAPQVARKTPRQLVVQLGQTAFWCLVILQGADDLEKAVGMADEFDGAGLRGPVDH